MEKKLIYGIKLDVNQLKELACIVEKQGTTDKDEPGEYTMFGDYGKYNYIITENHDVLFLGIK